METMREILANVPDNNLEWQGDVYKRQHMPRKKIDKLVEHAKGCGAKGLAYLCINEDGTYKSSFAKFMTEDELNALVAKMNGKPGDLLLFAADKNKIVWNVLGALRLQLGEELGLIDENTVSYTHLDVYKRQGTGHGSVSGNSCICPGRTGFSQSQCPDGSKECGFCGTSSETGILLSGGYRCFREPNTTLYLRVFLGETIAI